jgi:hypothetical protein
LFSNENPKEKDRCRDLGAIWFRSLVEQSGFIPFYTCLVEEYRSRVIPEKRIFLKDLE